MSFFMITRENLNSYNPFTDQFTRPVDWHCVYTRIYFITYRLVYDNILVKLSVCLATEGEDSGTVLETLVKSVSIKTAATHILLPDGSIQIYQASRQRSC
jgi:hypothetical protein